MQMLEQRIWINPHLIIRARRRFHQFYRFDDIPRASLELVIGESQLRAYLGFGCSFLRLHCTGPVRDGYAVSYLFTKKPVHRQAVNLTRDIQKCASERVRLCEGIQRKWILACQFLGFFLGA